MMPYLWVAEYSDINLNLILRNIQGFYSLSGHVLPQDLATLQSRNIRVFAFFIILKLDWHIGSIAAEMPVEFQTDAINIAYNLAASRLYEIWR